MDDERKQQIQRLAWLLVMRRRQRLMTPPKRKESKVVGCAVMAGLAILAIAGIWWAFSSCQPSAEERIEKEKETLEEKRKGFHCLSAWDGNHDGLEALIRSQLNDPGSMKTYSTSILPVSTDGTHTILVSFGARNRLGGMVRGNAVGSIDNKTCKATLSYIE